MSQTKSPIEIRHHSAVVSIQTSSSSVPPSTENISVASGISTTNQPSNRKFIIQEVVEPPGVSQQQPKPAASATQSGSPECGAYCGSPKQEQHHHHHHHHHLPHPGTGGSITIMTPPTTDNTSRINICINNHFPLMEAMPDLRRHHGQFGLSDEVLVHVVELDRFFLGTIIAIGERKCLVQFDDGTERWSAFEHLTRLDDEGKGTSDDVEKIETENGSGRSDEAGASGSGYNVVAHKGSATCVVCKEHKMYQVVKVCEGCYRGYHPLCHETLNHETIVLDDYDDDDDDDGNNGGDGTNGPWFCCRCTTPPSGEQSASALEQRSKFMVFDEQLTPLTPLTSMAQLPYDMHKLDWDLYHQVNSAGHYCYCGADGDWMKEMIQCNWCEQWFHGRCIRSLQYPIFPGDRHYLFLCSICNHGHEFVRRLVLSVSDLLHLVLFNLIMRNGHRLFDLNRAIVPFIEDNLRTLQMPEHFTCLAPNLRREVIATWLKANSKLFVNGPEVGLALGQEMWTLRTIEAPPKTSFYFPRGMTITENVLRKERPTLHFLPRVNLERSFTTDAMTRERMTGIAYSQPPFSTPDPRADPWSEEMRQWSATPTAEQLDAMVNGSGSAAGMDGEKVVASSNRRKYPPRYKLPIHPSMHTCAMDEIFPPPPDYRGSNNPFYTDPDAPTMVPRVARIVKRRMSAHDISNGRGKKKKLNNGVGVMMLGPQTGTSSRTVQAPRPVANSQPVVSTSSVDVQERSYRATRSSGNHSRNLRPRGATNYSDQRRYRRRRAATAAEQNITDDDTADGESGYLPRSRSSSISSASSSSSSASSSITIGDCLVTLPTGDVIVLHKGQQIP
ncbi:polycomb protein Pcl [Anopheles coustani]|uniref:polycomb protein Pcl n=1 Tax=Anopheles coustani TaxID=139045 RepID=UPI00265A48B8|nr:polycomb protein Pcl [Anopheles coustani]XP_058127489.1 polycomb protein Pcl [Anopheles coustani]